jgi:uncharacterized protein YyaL (SSP411 family)
MRVRPHVDDKILAGWNGLMIGSLAYAGQHLEEPRYTAAAKKAADFVLSHMRDNGRLLRVYRNGPSAISGYLEDYAFLADGLLDLFEATGNERYLREARALTDLLIREFADPAGGFFMTSEEHETLVVRLRPVLDSSTPSGNGVAAQVLVRLAHATGDAKYLGMAGATLQTFAGLMEQGPRASESLILAAAMYLDASRPDDAGGSVEKPPAPGLLENRRGR